MNYDLALKLKEAGFPQPDILQGDSTPGSWKHSTAYSPTLEELIDACGNGFHELVKAISAWKAKGGYRDEGVWLTVEIGGQTPSEAVANLWLLLNRSDLST